MIGWILGYMNQDFGYVYGMVALAQIICLVVLPAEQPPRVMLCPMQVMIPDWPIFNRNPVKWQPVRKPAEKNA